MGLVAVALVAGVVAPTVADAAKKRSGTVRISKPVNAPIPDRGSEAFAPAGFFTSTIGVGKRFKGKRVRDVNVTVQTSGATGLAPASDLTAYLTAPNGATTSLFSGLEGPSGSEVSSIGPLTLDDESPLDLGSFEPVDPTALYQPWAGTAQPGLPGLYVMDNGPVRGTWTLSVADEVAGGTSILNSWSLIVAAGKPYRTK